MEIDPFGGDLFSVFEEKQEKSKPKKRKEPEDVSSEEDNEKNSKKNKKDKSSKKTKELPDDGNFHGNAESSTNSTSKRRYDYVNDDFVTTQAPMKKSVANGSEKGASSSTSEVPKSSKQIPNGETEVISCLHEIAFPPTPDGQPLAVDEGIYNPTFPTNPARTWKFTLDPFQKMSVSCLERGESVLVSAHTSAGKTVIAEYAIAMSLKANQRVIYTSPIKALSNQKYRELYETFQDVGLMTGDITINSSASCLVMTTEILRNMLYRGSEVMREVAWVVFDEIHYMRDKERGVVWEETIILCPEKVRYVFLSATIPNAKEFAGWIAKVKNQPCHVVYTDVRPTPLQHYIFPSGGDGLHLVVDEKGNFKEENFQKALAGVGPEKRGSHDKKKKQTGAQSDIYKIVKMIIDKNYDPVIVFSFSKKECEALALQMAKLDLNTPEEKQMVEEVYNNATESLNEDDKTLPQVVHILPLLKRGIGIHHSGLLPILKETIEILFQEGLLKVLFATETFAMGLNMPAKTVVFTNVRKFDGENFRWISSGEYIQMSGRAGRRGLDDRGIVILMLDEKMEPQVAKNMIKGSADPLNSSFYISYNMLLNLLRFEGIEPEYMLKKSFHQFQNDRSLPETEKRLKLLEQEKDSIVIQDENVVSDYYLIREQLSKLKQVIRETINEPIHILPFLQPGRLARVKDGSDDWGWGVIVNFSKKGDKGTPAEQQGKQYIVDMLLYCSPNASKPTPATANEQGQMQVVPVLLHTLNGLSAVRVYIPKDLKDATNRQSVYRSIKEVSKRFPDGIPLLDPIEDMKIESSTFKKAIRKVEMFEDKLFDNQAFKAPDLMQRYEQYLKKLAIDNELKAIRKYIKNGESVILKHELKCMKRVLRRLGYTTQDDIIETKGRVACEINGTDSAELIITELMFTGVFTELDIEQCCALLSCFVFQEKVDANAKFKEELAGPFRKLQETARRIAKVAQESKISIDPEEYLLKFSPHMMEVVYSWCKGAKFSDICGMTDIFEGSIIRAMRRLEELLRQLCSAAKAIGNSELENKFAEGINKLKRDIVFAASLYL